MDDVLTVTEAAKLYGCSRPNMWYLMNTGRLPYRRVGSMAVIKSEDVAMLIVRRASRRACTSYIEPVREAA